VLTFHCPLCTEEPSHIVLNELDICPLWFILIINVNNAFYYVILILHNFLFSLKQGYSSGIYPAQSTFSSTVVPYPSDHTVYSHNYPSEPGFSGAVIQPPQNHVVPQVMAPTFVPLPVPPPVYNMPPSLPLGCPGQPAPFVSINEFPSTENRFSQPFHSTEKMQDYPQVPPPPKISQVIKFSWYTVNYCISSLLD
jgi:hypothetical protein